MKFVQYSAALLIAAFVLPGIARADGHGGAEDAVATAIGEYWAARNAGDHNAVANLESPAGIYGTNSDGSFHKPFAASSADDWKRNMAGQENNMQVFYPKSQKLPTAWCTPATTLRAWSVTRQSSTPIAPA